MQEKTPRLIEGFDYRTFEKVLKTRREWREEMAKVLENGGWRTVENGETFIHCHPEDPRSGTIVFEIYEVIPAPVPRRAA